MRIEQRNQLPNQKMELARRRISVNHKDGRAAIPVSRHGEPWRAMNTAGVTPLPSASPQLIPPVDSPVRANNLRDNGAISYSWLLKKNRTSTREVLYTNRIGSRGWIRNNDLRVMNL